MTWLQAKQKANEIIETLRSQYSEDAIRLILRALNRQHHKEKPMEKQIAQVIISENGSNFNIRAAGSFGGGYSTLASRDNVISEAAKALSYELYGTRPVSLVAPEWVRIELEKRGYKF